MNHSGETATVLTTLFLPADLLEATDRAVQAGKAQSRDEFIAVALRHEVAVHVEPVVVEPPLDGPRLGLLE